MIDIPNQLDGARVTWTAPASPGRLGHDLETGESVEIVAWAVAQYPGAEPRAYLFAVSHGGKVVADWLEDSPEAAMDLAMNSGFVSRGTWELAAE